MSNASDIISKYFPNLSAEQKLKFEKLGELYTSWNEKINVISRKDIDHLYIKHILHSLAIAKFVDFREGAEILDVGTGGGFPGIPLAILFPETNFHLVDSIGKKIKVVNAIAEELDLENVFAEKVRAEQLRGQYDFVVSRAVTRLKPFYQWIKNNVKSHSIHEVKNGIIYLKGGDLEEELEEAKKKCTIHDLTDYFEEDFFETKKVIHVPFG